jgi:hypothetical protein
VLRPTPTLLAGVVALLCLGLGAGCKKSGAARLEGHWRGTKVEGVPLEHQPAANDFALQTELDFRDGVVSVKTPREKITSKFRVAKEDKRALILFTEQDGPKDPQIFVFEDENTMRWKVVEGKLIVFRRIVP